MADSTDIIDVYPEDEEREYQDLIRKLNSVAPPVSSEGFDFSQIRGKFSGRTAKAMVLHLSCHGWSMVEIAEAFEVRV
ncbi:MAG TPA: hypothetical protein VM537_07525, partial [Anaerolineae bacterium]|nr:hypothetical protein [Anaerolineae bacterium]